MSVGRAGEAPMHLSRYTPDRPLLMWTDFPPEFAGGGAVILRSLLPAEDRERIVWASPSPETERASRSDGRVVRLRAGALGRAETRSLLLDSTVLAKRIADETLRVARDAGARAIWIVLHGAGVPVAAELVRRKELPVHATVHDDPAFAVAMRSRRYLALTPWIERCFARAVAGATSVDVISEAMGKRYEARYGARAVVVHRGVPGPVAPSPPFDAKESGLRIGVLGNTYTYDQLPVLGRAVARAARTLGVRGRVTVMGRGAAERLRRDLAALPDVEVEETGHVAEADAIALLRTCFALYLNYPFTRREAVLRQTSFPTKLSTYVLAARPILSHAPTDSTLAPLAAYAGYVHSWTSMDEAVGESVLVRAWRDDRTLESAHVAAEAVRARYFDPARNRRALLGALDALVTPLVLRGVNGVTSARAGS